jgi:hypothetical protein
MVITIKGETGCEFTLTVLPLGPPSFRQSEGGGVRTKADVQLLASAINHNFGIYAFPDLFSLSFAETEGE